MIIFLSIAINLYHNNDFIEERDSEINGLRNKFQKKNKYRLIKYNYITFK